MEDLKTIEFQKRRRQRLEQVREQSKVIARTLRERASVERLRQLGSVEQTRREDYIQRQERVVQRLERIHEGALRAVGDAHSQAADLNEKEKNAVRPKDQSKNRAKVAVEELNRRRQHDLDKKKQQLERKLIARKLANARSRSRLSKATGSREEDGSGDGSSKKISNSDVKLNANGSESVQQSSASATENTNAEKSKASEVTSESDPKKRDMQTQWSLNGLQEWTPSNILSAEGLRDQVNNVPSAKDVEKSSGKQTNLFAVSPEMPEDLLGHLHKNAPAADLDNKPSVTIVSDFLRARDHRLQKPRNGFYKVTGYEMQGLRETFRPTRKDFTSRGTEDICRVVDDEIVPVPSWEPVPDCGFCKVDRVPLQHSNVNRNLSHPNRIKTRSRSAVNLCPRDSSPSKERISTDLQLDPVSGATAQTHESHHPETTSPSRACKSHSSGLSHPLRKSRCVMHYDHCTKATRDVPLVNDNLVEKITEKDVDAYSLALKESERKLADTSNSRPTGDGNQQRNRVAVSRQKVAQEYRDTMAFLQAVTRNNDKAKPIESAYMDDYQQQQRKVSRQRKLQQEFEKVQAVSKCKARSTRVSETITHVDRASLHKSNEPQKSTSDLREEETTKVAKTSLNDAEELLNQIRKSMPIREDLSVKIPRDKEEPRKSSKTGNTVTFDTTPSTYTYTSRVKHTPPTRDKPDPSENQSTDNDKNIDINNIDIDVVEQDNASDNTIVSDCSSDYDLIIQRHNKAKSKESNDGKTDVRKFIVYKIKDSSEEDAIKKIKNKYKSTNDKPVESKSESSTIQLDVADSSIDNQKTKKSQPTSENLKESNEEFVDAKNDDHKQVGEKTASDLEGWNKKNIQDKENDGRKPSKQISKKPLQWDIGAGNLESQTDCKSCGSRIQELDKNVAASTATSAATFQTATSEKSSCVPSASTMIPPGAGGYVKVLDEAGAEAGKFYIGASNLSRDDPYEVIIQLKGKNGFRGDKNNKGEKSTQHSKPITDNIFVKHTSQKSAPCPCSTSKTPAHNFQFSSSSSTVYMSPPDLILPKFLKVNNPFKSVITDQIGAHESPKKKIQNAQEEIISLSHYIRRDRLTNDQETREAKGDKRKSTLKSLHKRKHHRPKSVTKSTSSMSSMSVAPRGDHKKTCRDSSSSGCPCSGYRTQRCRKKVSTAKHDHSRRINHQKHKQSQLEKKIMEHCQNHMQNIFNKNEKNKSSVPNSSISQSNLSPTIKKYINELLKISKDEPKSAKIATLHCSTVSTPGSSVINIPTNVDPKWSEWEQDAIQAKLNEVLTKNLIKHLRSSKHKNTSISHRQHSNQHHNIEASAATITSTSSASGMQSVERIKGDVPQLRLHRLRTKPKSLYRNKVKSLNIARNIGKHFSEQPQKSTKSTSKFSSSDVGQKSSDATKRNKTLKCSKNISKSSLTDENVAQKSLKTNFDDEIVRDIKLAKILTSTKRTSSAPNKRININNEQQKKAEILFKNQCQDLKDHTKTGKAVLIETYPDKSARQYPRVKDANSERISPVTVETKPTSNSDNFMYLAEEKFKNMEKIANLTEKCTKRLSNLAKVLDEVRKNKSKIYNQISSSDTSLSEKCSGKRENYFINKSKEEDTPQESLKNVPKFTGNNQSMASSLIAPQNTPECEYPKDLKKHHNGLTVKIDSVEFVPILGDIPKPESTPFKHTDFDIFSQSHSVSAPKPNTDRINSDIPYGETMKVRAKPPPALCRVNFKNDETLVPHELSTVLEVDSPTSNRNTSSRIRTKDRSPININVVISSGNEEQHKSTNAISDRSVLSAFTSTTPSAPPVSPMTPDNKKDNNAHAVKVDNNETLNTISQFKKNTKDKLKCSILMQSHENSSEISKLQMIDLIKFNEIMMKPFISIEEYARQYNVPLLEEASNIEDTGMNKNTPNRDEEISSDGTLPDIISELLKRNIISEPFNFDGISNVDCNALSSESNLSLALSKIKRDEKKVTINTNSQDNGDTSDTLSFSPKVDLEKAFEELGFGWASSTLKKTKETLALSSSTSTASSIDHTNYRKFKKFDATKKLLRSASLMKDTSKPPTTSIEHAQPASTAGVPPESEDKENIYEQPKKSSKHSVELQTSLSFRPPVTVKEFLTSSLADKITFGRKAPDMKAEEHYSSLYSTKLTTGNSFEESDGGKLPVNDSSDHGNVSKQTRQRTSTPVQLFKSLTFNSSTSSYNNSNGLFSNIDDLSSVKGTSLSVRNSSSTDRDELTIPNCSLKVKNDKKSDCSNIS